MSTEAEQIAGAIRRRRDQLGITQEQLAVQAEVSGATVRNVEAGKTVRPGTIRKLARALRVTMAELESGSILDGPTSPSEIAELRATVEKLSDEESRRYNSHLLDQIERDLDRVRRNLNEESSA